MRNARAGYIFYLDTIVLQITVLYIGSLKYTGMLLKLKHVLMTHSLNSVYII